MKNSGLATWLRDHKESLIASSEEGGRAFDVTLIDSVLEVARTGRTGELDAAAKQTAHQAVMQEVPLDQLLRGPRRLKGAIWEQLIQAEMPPSERLDLIKAAEPVFSWLTKSITQSYFDANQTVQDALASEIAHLNSEFERRVMNRTSDLTRTNVELRKLEQAKTDFIGIAAHELKTPLTLIQGYASMLREMSTEEGSPGNMRLLEGVLRGAERLSAIVEDMLDVSAIATDALSLRIEQVAVPHVINLVVAQSARYFKERNQTVHIDELTPLPSIEMDPRRLHQILSQLLNNAIKYTPDGGEIFIGGRVWSGDRSARGESGETDQAGAHQFVELTFRDTGVGIAPEDRERIFEKFYRTGKSELHSTGKVKFQGAGPGLGLPIARGLAEAHGGRLWAESPGHDEVNCPGSTFHLMLPVRARPKPGITAIWVEPLAGAPDEEGETPEEDEGTAEHGEGER